MYVALPTMPSEPTSGPRRRRRGGSRSHPATTSSQSKETAHTSLPINAPCSWLTATVAITATAALLWPVFAQVGERDEAKDAKVPCLEAFSVKIHHPSEIDAAHRALSLIQTTYGHEYYHSSISHHQFVRTAPEAIREALSEFVWSNHTLKQVRTNFQVSQGIQAGVRVIPDVFDEIYLMRPEFDWVDQKKIHYDGNLKLPGVCTIRALTYLSGGSNASLVALTTGKSYPTRNHTSVVLDFDRELHYVSLGSRTSELDREPPRVLIKSALHVIPSGTHPLRVRFQIVLHRIMVFVARSVRRAFESQSSPTSQTNGVSLMAIDNLMRSLNKIHMALPLILVGLPLVVVLLSPLVCPNLFLPYVALIVARCLWSKSQAPDENDDAAIATSWKQVCVAYGLWGSVGGFRSSRKARMISFHSKSPSAAKGAVFKALSILLPLHVAWIGVYCYVEANADMANQFLFAPWQNFISLDDIH